MNLRNYDKPIRFDMVGLGVSVANEMDIAALSVDVRGGPPNIDVWVSKKTGLVVVEVDGKEIYRGQVVDLP